MEPTVDNLKYPFLSGGGEMGRLIREKDWSKTSLGSPENWPQSLRTVMSILLKSKFPKFVMWGEDLICFYNDAYRPSLGEEGKHPHILGEKAKIAWAEIWDFIKPLFDTVLIDGESVWREDQIIPIFRNGKIEEAYWTFSYTPLENEEGEIVGILSTCVETTSKVHVKNNLEKLNRRYLENIMQAQIAMCVLRGENFVVEMVNPLMLEVWGKPQVDFINKPVFDELPEAKGQGLEQLLIDVYTTGNKFVGNEHPIMLPRNGELTTTYINFVYEPLKTENGLIDGIVVTATDVTSQVLARKKIEENEIKLQYFIKASELGTWDLDLTTMDVQYSGRYLEIFGFDKNSSHLSHPNLLELLHPDDIYLRNEAFGKALTTGMLNYQSRIIWGKDKSVHWIEAKGEVFYDEDKKPLKMTGIIRDITQEKIAEQELKDREEKFRLLADEMPQFVWIADAQGKLTYFNQSLYNFTGLTSDDTLNDKWTEFIHPDDREQNYNVWMNSVNTGTNYIFENRFRRYDGVYRWQLSRAKPHIDDQGNIQMWVGTSTDINDMKELDEQKDYFISMASHELKTPLTSIKGYVQLLESRYKNTEDAFLKNSLKVVNKQIESLISLVVDLLDVSKIKSGALPLKKRNFVLNELVEEVVEEMQNMHQNVKIVFYANSKENIVADDESLKQVLINFLSNAFKYSPNSLEVHVKLEKEENDVIVSVQDFGIGINEENQKKIFDRFYRVEGRNEKNFPGFGIGLFIASEIIRKHNGKIGVTSEFGKGSTFYFSLPSNS